MNIKRIIREEVKDFEWIEEIPSLPEPPISLDTVGDLVGYRFKWWNFDHFNQEFDEDTEQYVDDEWEITKVTDNGVYYKSVIEGHTSQYGIEQIINNFNEKIGDTDGSWPLVDKRTGEVFKYYYE